MKVFGYYKSAINNTEYQCELVVNDKIAEWVYVDSEKRISASPIWLANHLEGLEWFKKVYADLGARFELK